ncbi:2OG-Fe dioxygenase family protein [Halomonas sp. H5]|uniref:2OG-Fe dioxygenase family protein n=1 Tax=Halomonas sp. H5 TaxID=3423910 RepID=UPI003D362F6F
MKQESLKHGFDLSTLIAETPAPYWQPEVSRTLTHQDWCVTDVSPHLDLDAWGSFLATLPRDPYVNRRWKRMAWFSVADDGAVEVMGDCPMAQGGRFNDADSMADKLRYYPSLEEEFLERADVHDFVRHWARLWGIGPREPILMQITGVRGKGTHDPLQGQGIHADGCRFLSILVLNRDNVAGGTSRAYADKAGSRVLMEHTLAPGEILHLRDDRLFHSADALHQMAPEAPFERFIVIINSRFVDPFQNKMLKRYFPDSVLDPQ